MLTKQSLTRIAAASVAGLVVAMSGTGPAQADSKHDAHGSSRAAAGSSERAHPAAHRHAAHAGSSKDATPQRHTPVTVCHLLGNGSYNLLTFDRRALDAHQAHGDLYPVPADGCPEPAASERSTSEPSAPERAQAPTAPRHQRVTVCHLLGNDSYNVLSFDRHALRAHLAHGDLYPVPADGCPASAVDNTAGPTAPDTSTETIDESTTAGPVAPMAARPAVVAGVELARTPAELAAYRTLAPSAVLGTDAVAGASTGSMTSAPSAGTQTASAPSSGVLPQTGAAPIAGALLTGLGLLAAGAVLLRRRTRTNA